MLKNNSSTLFTNKLKPNYSNLYQVIDQFRDSHIEVDVTSTNGTETQSISELIRQTISQSKNAIFTFTSGPFLDENELPENWKHISISCCNQLAAFEEMYKNMNAVIYAVNKHTSPYQRDLLIQNNLPHLFMISDADGKLEKTFHLPTFDISDPDLSYSRYFHRFSFDFRNNGMRIIYIPMEPVDKIKALEHVNDIQNFNESVIHESPVIRPYRN